MPRPAPVEGQDVLLQREQCMLGGAYACLDESVDRIGFPNEGGVLHGADRDRKESRVAATAWRRVHLVPLCVEHDRNVSQRGVFDDVSVEGELFILIITCSPCMVNVFEEIGHGVSH